MTVAVPIAVIGMACRFPGVESVAAFSALLRTGRSTVARPNAARLAWWGAGAAEPPAAGLLDGIQDFDRHPFRISANEAPLIDPQQRLVLEMSWHALENAGLPPACLDGLPAGVFIGAGSSDHAIRMAERGAVRPSPHLPNAVQNAAISGRVSYCLGLTGPSLTVDTACSSSLTAVTLACDSLRLGHCDVALAGGVNVLLSPAGFSVLGSMGVLSPSGQTRSFDAAADGFVRSEGCGITVLKRLPDALREGDRIHAVLPGWATGQDGRSNGLGAPSRAAQVRVIAGALKAAGMTADDIGVIEAHGSATALGDSIEALALAEVFAGRTRPPAALGSVKAALGHLEAAAGVAGLIKAVLMVRDGMVPQQPCFELPSPRINWDNLPFEVPRETRDWKEPRRAAGVSSFGMSGLNAHVVVTSYENAARPAGPGRGADRQPQPFLFSAASRQALADRAGQLCAVLDGSALPLQGLAAAVSRVWGGMGFRAGFLASTVDEAMAAAAAARSHTPRAAVPAAASAGTRIGGSPHELLMAHLAGARFDPRTMFPAEPVAADLPGYPFDRQLCWYDMPRIGQR